MDFIAASPCRAQRIAAARFIRARASSQRNYLGRRVDSLGDYERRVVRQAKYRRRCGVGIDCAAGENGRAVELSFPRRRCLGIHEVMETHSAPAEEALVVTRRSDCPITYLKRRCQ